LLSVAAAAPAAPSRRFASGLVSATQSPHVVHEPPCRSSEGTGACQMLEDPRKRNVLSASDSIQRWSPSRRAFAV
jgi:hypothetical protein